MLLTPVTLEGGQVRLEPLATAHLPGLLEIGLAPELWALTVDRIRTAADLTRYVERALADAAAGAALPFATVWRATGEVIGSTRFGNYVAAHRRAEIGWTWLAPAWQRTAANTEAKLLMLGHAFEGAKLRRVEFKTSTLNQKSRAALARLGAVEEGVFRQHMINEDGSNRDSVYCSILDSEWPAVRERLSARLASG
jgi:RimJ/RimL family protein N-acetyltransferase